MSDTLPRPSHTTMAAGMVIGGSVFVVLTVAEQLSGLSSLETREAVQTFLAEPPGDALGLDVSGALAFLRVALMVVAGCATAAAVLGYHVLQRSHRARIGLSVLAVPLFVGGLATGGFLTSLVAAASMLLWIGPSKLWFDGVPQPEAPSRPRPGQRGDTPASRPEWPPPLPTSPENRPEARPEWPPPAGPPAAPPTTPYAGPGQPPPYTSSQGAWPPPALAAPSRPERRPDAVLWACVLTWAFCGVTLVLVGASLTLLVADPGVVWDELQRQDPDLAARSGLDRDSLVQATYVTMGVVVAWTLAAGTLAVLVLRRSRGARIALLVCAGIAAGFCLLATLSSAVMLVPASGCLATVALLSRPEVRAWFRPAAPRSVMK
ncbi:hypothetical protein [Nocardioides euryhalodurans]|uniref:DUF4064 domain-containing protein n=1 Tax=Nocardioides euryhalodurans TaxID=2518370 RepID=A0A4P7GM39_9ACTN|nr:hypothetical protein [Nocardioides euryhalodurans]QBR93218.1 hypothetical protein EXE57_13800 [Nocardioides euryhalodurans]